MSQLSSRAPLAFLLVLLSGCAGSQSPPTEPMPPQTEAEQRLAKLASREGDRRPMEVVASEDGEFTATVPASPSGPVETIERSYRLLLDIGTDSPVDCYVSPEALDVANSLVRFNESTTQQVAANVGSVQSRVIDTIDAGAFGNAGFVAMNWVYQIGDPVRPVVGHLKQRIASKNDRSFYCQHFEVGYHETFRKLFEALVQSSDFPGGAPPRPAYTRIVKATIGERVIGLQRATALRDAKGSMKIKTVTSLLTLVDANTATAQDSYSVEITDADGKLLRQVYAATQDDRLTRQLALIRSAKGWRLQGRVDAEGVNTTLRSDAPLLSSLAQRRALRDALAEQGAGARLSYQVWVPEADTLALATRTISAYEALADGDFKVRSSTGDTEVDAVVGANGSTRSSDVKRGKTVMHLERVYSEGEL